LAKASYNPITSANRNRAHSPKLDYFDQLKFPF
jgi:hypothetical protein